MLKSFAFIFAFLPCLPAWKPRTQTNRLRPSHLPFTSHFTLLTSYFLLILLFGCTERQVRIHFEQAEKYRHEGKIDLAIEEYKAILALSPDAFDARNNLGYLYVGKGQYANAIAQYQKAIAIKPDFAEALFNLGVAYVEYSQIDSAIAAYQRALQYDPENHEIHNNLGAAHTMAGNRTEAEVSYQQALKLKPEYADVYHNLGLLYTYEGRYRDAIPQYEKAIRYKPNFPDAYNNMGSAYLELGQHEDAIQHFQTAVRLQPNHALAQENLRETKTRIEAREAGEMRAQHILVKTEADAHKLLEQLDSGAKFEALAQLYSTDTASGRQGGDLGAFLPGTLLPKFEQAVKKIEPGKIGGPVKTPAGYHIIKRIY